MQNVFLLNTQISLHSNMLSYLIVVGNQNNSYFSWQPELLLSGLLLKNISVIPIGFSFQIARSGQACPDLLKSLHVPLDPASSIRQDVSFALHLLVNHL